MRYIVRFLDKLSVSQRESFTKLVTEIIYESKFLPLMGVVTNQPHEIEKLGFVKHIRISEEGNFQEGEFLSTIIFEPPVRKGALVSKQLLGWGDTRVVIIDSGVSGNDVSITEYKDFTGTGNADIRNHGTVVANIIKHFAKGAVLYSAKVGAMNPDELNVMRALEWAVDKGANIVNISAGFKRAKPCKGDCDLCQLVSEVSSQGIAVIVAAGNNQKVEDSIDCPGTVDNTVTVGAVDKYLRIASYSSIGKPGSGKPNIVAPGGGYLNGVPFEGTSFSAPLVAGVLAAILYRVGNIHTAIEYIYNTASDLKLPRHHQGFGCINLEKLVEVVVNETINSESQGQDQGS